MIKKAKAVKIVLAAGCLLGAGAWGYFALYSCNHDVYCLEERDPWLQKRLQRDVPLFVVNDLEKRRQGVPAEVWRILKRNMGKFMEFHQRHKDAGPISCAVVANGSTVLGAGLGEFIDSHTYVFRMNGAPIEGYEKDVGTRTTISVLVDDPGFVIPNRGPEHFAVVWGGHVFQALGEQWLGTATVPSRRLKMESLDTPVMIMHIRFVQYIKRNWFTPDTRFTNEETPSTGFRTIILALHLCNTVNLFGFGPDAWGRWDHYYNKRGLIAKHRPNFQEDFINKLDARGIVTRYFGNMNQPK